MANEIEKVDVPGCLVDEASFTQLLERICELETRQTAEVLRASSNSTGLRWNNTNLPANTVVQAPYNNIISLTNTNPVPVVAEIKWNFGDSYMFIADGDLRVRIYGEVLNGAGGVIESTGIAHYNWLDSEPFNNNQQQTEMRPNGAAFNDRAIVVQPGDTISARQYITAQAIGGGTGNERIYWYNGQTTITFHPQTVYVP